MKVKKFFLKILLKNFQKIFFWNFLKIFSKIFKNYFFFYFLCFLEFKRPEELIRIEPKLELIESTQIDVTSTGGHPYGPWVPVKKEIPKPE